MVVQQQKSKVSGLCHQHHQRGRGMSFFTTDTGVYDGNRGEDYGVCKGGPYLTLPPPRPHPMRVRAAAAVKQSPAAVKTDRGTFHIYKYYF